MADITGNGQKYYLKRNTWYVQINVALQNITALLVSQHCCWQEANLSQFGANKRRLAQRRTVTQKSIQGRPRTLWRRRCIRVECSKQRAFRFWLRSALLRANFSQAAWGPRYSAQTEPALRTVSPAKMKNDGLDYKQVYFINRPLVVRAGVKSLVGTTPTQETSVVQQHGTVQHRSSLFGHHFFHQRVTPGMMPARHKGRDGKTP